MPETTRPKGTVNLPEVRAWAELHALKRSIGRRLTMDVLTLSRRSGLRPVPANRLALVRWPLWRQIDSANTYLRESIE